MGVQTYRGGCHCGGIRYAAEMDLSKGSIRCNCSLCSKSRAWFAFVPAEAFRLESDDGGSQYRWTPPGKERPNLTYHFCENCGVRIHAEGKGPDGAATVAVQVATIEGADPEVLKAGIRYVDGRHDRFDREPENVEAL
jgi:hypothetical protein